MAADIAGAPRDQNAFRSHALFFSYSLCNGLLLAVCCKLSTIPVTVAIVTGQNRRAGGAPEYVFRWCGIMVSNTDV
jgi:hypothetical protein